MKTQTLEVIIEELASALQIERLVSQSLREENTKLKETAEELKKLLDSKCDACAGRRDDNG